VTVNDDPKSLPENLAGSDAPALTDNETTLYVPSPLPDRLENVMDRTFTLSGREGVDNAGEIIVYNKVNGNQEASTDEIGVDGRWSVQVRMPTSDTGIDLYLRQRVGAQFSATVHMARIYLAEISQPLSNALLVSGSTFRGTASPRSRISVQTAAGVVLAPEVVVAADSHVWSTNFNNAGLLGDRVTVVALWSRLGFPSGSTEAKNYRLLSIPSITSPGPNTIQNETFLVSGTQGENGATVKVYAENLDDPLGQSLVPGDGWNVEVTALPGPVSLVATQSLSGTETRRSSPVGVRIRPPRLTTPAVTYPTQRSAQFSGDGHTGATVEFEILSGPGEALPPPLVTVTGGRWEATSTNFQPSTYSLKLIQKLSDNAGGWIESEPLLYTLERPMSDLV